MNRIFVISILFLIAACSSDYQSAEMVDEDQLGLISADVKSEDTNLKSKATYIEDQPGSSIMMERSFENAPPLIPHTTEGFLPIKIQNNICLTCHMPDKIAESGAIAISETHFSNWRPQPKLVDGLYQVSNELTINVGSSNNLNNLYFNCNQCHVSQSIISVDIENLFTSEFREEFGLKKSSLNAKVSEGVKN